MNDLTRAVLRERLRAVIERGVPHSLDDAEFEELALGVFAHQYAHNRPYRAFCDARGSTPRGVHRWIDIPAVPTDAFKAAPLVAGDPAAAAVVFRTSGTTAGRDRRGAHYFLDTSLYSAALRASGRAHLLPDRERIRILSLVASPRTVPHSSLSFMIGEFVEAFGTDASEFFVGAEGVLIEPLIEALDRAAREGEAVFLPGTSFAFVHLLDALEKRRVTLTLPAGSRAMETGGLKGRSREVSRPQLYALMESRLGVPQSHLVSEYGMTEMSSQLYDAVVGTDGVSVGERAYRAPGWVRVVVVDPETLRPRDPGQTGVLRILDLANVDSVAALQTADLGVTVPGGVRLLGRASDAEGRGCSLAMEELLEVLEGQA